MSPSLNVVLFGETGVGKSSVINLIAGREIAETSPDVQGCTVSFKPYTFPVSGQNFHIWNTLGLEESEMDINAFLIAIEQAGTLIRHLASQGGVDLLLFCLRGNRITATVQTNYRLFYEFLCRSKVPIALVITHLGREENMEGWWVRNEDSLKGYGIKSAGHACVTGLPRHRKYGESMANIKRLLEGGNGGVERFTMPPDEWYIEFLRLFGLLAPLKKDLKKKDVVKVLTKRCRLDPNLAEEVANKLTGDDATTPLMSPTSLNIILFGETGVGKSSVINLIAGREIAETAPGVQGCTMSFKPYAFTVSGQNFHFWDTVGLEEPEMGINGSQGGVDLLLFCIRRNRITPTTQSNYRLFYEFLCKSKVPIALVITHLEQEEQMEDWWMRNEDSLRKYGVKPAGHACVTGLPRHRKYGESKANIKRLLEGGNGGVERFTMPPDEWYIGFLRLFGLFSPLKKESKKKDVVKVLTKRCRLDPNLAEEVANKLTKGSATGSL